MYAPFSRAIDACFERLGVEATYTPNGGQPVTVRVIASRPDEVIGFGDTKLLTETATFDLRASEIATPRPGDRLTHEGVDYVMQGEPMRKDPDLLVWTLDTRPA